VPEKYWLHVGVGEGGVSVELGVAVATEEHVSVQVRPGEHVVV